MVNAHDDNDGTTRRASLLPQRSNAKQTMMRSGIVAKPLTSIIEATNQRSRETSGTSIEQRPSHRTASMLPPRTSNVSRSKQNPAKAPTLRRPSVERPPSQDPSRASARARTSSAGQDSQSRARVSHHGRSVSHQVERTAIPSILSSSLGLKRQSSTRSQRPAFTAMQQSFTPKKATNARPLSPSAQLAREDMLASAECFDLQMELAQLHLLHRSAHAVQCQWENSAEKCFQERFKALSERHSELREIADQQQALVNQLALVQWSQDRSGSQIADKVALLSRTIAEVCSLIDLDGKYTHILGVFQSWFAQALQTREQRKMCSTKGPATMDIIEGIGDGWKAESTVLERELAYYLRELKAFGSVQPSSSLAGTLSLYSKMVLNLGEELDAIQWIENEITTQESLWVESTIQRLASDVNIDIGAIGKH